MVYESRIAQEFNVHEPLEGEVLVWYEQNLAEFMSQDYIAGIIHEWGTRHGLNVQLGVYSQGLCHGVEWAREPLRHNAQKGTKSTKLPNLCSFASAFF